MLEIKFSDDDKEMVDQGCPTNIEMKFTGTHDMMSSEIVDRFKSFMKALGYSDNIIANGMMEVAYEIETNSEGNDWMRKFMIEQGEDGVMSREELDGIEKLKYKEPLEFPAMEGISKDALTKALWEVHEEFASDYVKDHIKNLQEYEASELIIFMRRIYQQGYLQGITED